MRKLPVVTRIDGIDVKSVFGQPLFSMYQQMIRLLLVGPRGKQLQHFFSEPSLQKTDGTILWYTRADGLIRSWDDLTPKEQDTAFEVVRYNCQVIEEICAQLRVSQGESAATVDALKSMLITPGLEKSLCMVGQSLVLAQWGCRPFGTAASDFALEVQGNKTKQVNGSLLRAVASPETETSQSDSQLAAETLLPDGAPEPTTASFTNDIVQEESFEEADTEPERVSETISDSNNGLIWRWVVILTLFALLIIGLLLKSCSTTGVQTTSITPTDLNQMAGLIAAADDKLLQCRPPTDPPLSDRSEGVPILTPDALAQNEVAVFGGRWILRADGNLTIGDQAFELQIQFDHTGAGRTNLRTDDGTECSGNSEVFIQSPNSFRMALSELICVGSMAGVAANEATCKVSDSGRVANCTLRCVNGPCSAEFLKE